MADEVASIIKGLSDAQRQWFHRGALRMGRHIVPQHIPICIVRTWNALEDRKLIERGRYGYHFTELGLRVRARVCGKD